MLTLALLRDSSDLHIYKDLYGKITIVSVTYENVAIKKKSSYLALAECFSLLAVFGPIHGHSVSFRETGLLSLYTFYLASVKFRRQAKTTDGKSNYRPCSTRNFKATGPTGENLRPFSFSMSDRLLRPSTQPWEVYLESKPVSLKLTEWP